MAQIVQKSKKAAKKQAQQNIKRGKKKRKM
jgi:hypothetical protein